MRLGIRSKLMGLLTVVALLPLLAALAGLVIGATHLRRETVGQTILSVATSEARALEVSLVKDIEKLQIAMEDQDITGPLARVAKPRPAGELEDLDRRWATIKEDEEPLREILNGPVAQQLRLIQNVDPRTVKILVADRFGQTVASTIRTDDFYQGDEDWWQGTCRNGQLRVYVPQIGRDPSTHLWSVNLCVPITCDGNFVGVAKAVLDVSRWMGAVTRSVGEMSAGIMLVSSEGRIIYRPGAEPLATMAPHWYGPIAEGRNRSWRLTPDGEIQAFARIALPAKVGAYEVKMPSWVLVLYMPESAAMGPLYRLSWIMLAVGLAIIGAIFIAGLFLVDRGTVRRIRHLEHATNLVAGGNLSHRVEIRRGSWGLFGGDEIDDLAGDFNRMIERVQKSYQQLAEANELKTNFIRVASHELRTPVSYILGMARLLKDSRDSDRLLQALSSISARAQRLDDIIQAMFKLMPEQRFAQVLQYSPVVMRELMEEIYLDCQPFIEKRSQRLVIEDPGTLPTIRADREKLRDIVENLLLNAIKFTPDGGLVKVGLGKRLDGGVLIAVHDQGLGIPQEELPRLFQPFYSGSDVLKHSSGTSEYQKRGMGLGLTIVKHFVDLHGGTITVQTGSTGSVFTVSIPAGPGAAQAPVAQDEWMI